MKDKVLWIIIALLSLVLLLTQSFLVLAESIKLPMLIASSLSMIIAFLCTIKGQQSLQFAKSAYVELQKIVWPTRAETVQTTMIVMAMVAVTGLVLWGLDSIMLWAVGKITHLG